MCAMGEATSCSCKDEELELPQDDSDVTYTEGCSDNVDFGITFAKQFLVRRHGGSGLQQEIELHNMLIGASVSIMPLYLTACTHDMCFSVGV